jgi:hypothetical protein
VECAAGPSVNKILTIKFNCEKKFKLELELFKIQSLPQLGSKNGRNQPQNIPLIIDFPTVPRTCPNFFSSPKIFVQYSITLAWYV